MRDWLGADALNGWPAFAASWDDLDTDEYMADGGRYRRRRYACFSVDGLAVDAAAAPAALPERRLQRAERRHRPLVLAGRGRDGAHPLLVRLLERLAATFATAAAGADHRRVVAGRDAPVPHRSQPAARRPADTGGPASRRRRLGGGHPDRPSQRRRRGHRGGRRRTAARWARSRSRRRSTRCCSTTIASGTASRRCSRSTARPRRTVTCWCSPSATSGRVDPGRGWPILRGSCCT